MAIFLSGKKTKLPAIGTKNDFSAIKQRLETYSGERGKPEDQVVLLRDLVAAGLADIKLNRDGTVSITRPGDGDITARPVAGDGNNANNDVSVPPPPTNLQAQGGFAAIYLSWNAPNFGNYSHTEVWRASVNNVGQAVLIGSANSPVFADSVSGGTYYYWVRYVTTGNPGTPGSFNAVAGTVATTSYTSDYILDILTIPWQQGSYAVGDYIVPSPANQTGVWYRATVGGNTGGTEPNWITANDVGETIVDGQITWTAVAQGSFDVPFIIGEVGGIPVVVMDTQAYISDASITNAKIQSLVADKITAGTITAAIEMTTATMTGGLLRTSAGTGWRVIVDGQSGAAYPIWYGNGAVTAENANFYLDLNGTVYLKGSVVTNSLLTNSPGTNFIDLGAVNSQVFLQVGTNIQILADGSGYFSRVLLSAPNIIAAGEYIVPDISYLIGLGRSTARSSEGISGQIGRQGVSRSDGEGAVYYVQPYWLIDTGVNVGTDYFTAASLQYSGNATLAHGTSTNGGVYGHTETTIVIGDGFATGAFGPAYGGIDGRIYLLVAFYPVNGSGIRVTHIDWKLVQL